MRSNPCCMEESNAEIGVLSARSTSGTWIGWTVGVEAGLSIPEKTCDDATPPAGTTTNSGWGSGLGSSNILLSLDPGVEVEDSDADSLGDGGRGIEVGVMGRNALERPTGTLAARAFVLRVGLCAAIEPFDPTEATVPVFRTSNPRTTFGIGLVTGGRTRASWERVGRLRFLAAVLVASDSPGSLALVGSPRVAGNCLTGRTAA